MTDLKSASNRDPSNGEQQDVTSSKLLAAGSETNTTWTDPLAFVASGKWITVSVGETQLARSSEAIIVHEQGHLPVCYFPRVDVCVDAMTPIDHRTHCPRKGDASYFAVGGASGPIVAWSYEDPIPAARILKDYVAFYPDQTELHKED